MVIGTPTVLNLIPGGVMKVIHVNQVNENIEIQFRIMNGAQPFNVPEGVSCTIRGTKGDNFGYAADVAVTAGSNIVTATLTEQLTAVAGAGNIFELVFVGASDDMKVSTENFILDVERAALGEDTVVSDSDLAYADQVLNQLQSVGAVNAQVQQNKANIAAEITRATAAEQTLQQNINAEAAARQAADNTLQSNINAEASSRATTDASLQSQINQLVAPSGEAPSAAEVENARIGSDGTVYPTLGDAIRGQVSDVKSALGYYTPLQYNESAKSERNYNGIPRVTWNATLGEKVNTANRACIDPILLDHSMDKFSIESGYLYMLYAGNAVGMALTQISSGWTAASVATDLSPLWTTYKYLFVAFQKVGGADFAVGEDLTAVATITYYTEPLKYLSKLDIPLISPQEFGAKADGVTDDTDAIQDCIDYASLHKQSVALYGHYIITDTLVVPQGVTIFGSGKNTLLENTNDTVYSILAQGSNVSISNFWLKCNLGVQISDNTHRANDIQIEKLIIRTPTTVFHIPNATGNVTIRDCYCITAGTSGTAVIIGDGSLISNVGVNYVYFYNSSFESMTKNEQSNAFDKGFEIYGGQYIYIDGCDICGYRTGVNIATATQSISDLFFSNTTFFQNRRALSFVPVQVLDVSFSYCVFILKYDSDDIGVIGGINNLFFEKCLYKYIQDIDSVILELRNLENVVVDISGNFKTKAKKNLSIRNTTLNIQYEHHYIPFVTGSSALSFSVGNQNSLTPLKKPSVIVNENINATVTEQNNGTYLVSIPASTEEYSGFIVC